MINYKLTKKARDIIILREEIWKEIIRSSGNNAEEMKRLFELWKEIRK